jgi:CRISPR/Cas system-associated exonuclease Cas4 (RecB family)
MAELAWSYSRVECFEQCPRKFQLQNLIKAENFKFRTNPITERGKAVHTSLENALLGEPLPPELEHVAPIIAAIKAEYPEVQTERDIAFDRQLNMCDWFDTQVCWFRAQLDVLAINGTKAIIYDWKTGKVRDKPDQLRLYAAVVFLLYPEVQEVHTAFIFVDHTKICDATYTRDQFQSIWDEFQERADLIQIANESNQWPPRKNHLCNWCDAKKDQCVYAKKV